MKKIRRILVLLLSISIIGTSVGDIAFASSETSADTLKELVSEDTQNLKVDGTDSVGTVLASAISKETKVSEERKQSADNIMELEFQENTATVEFQTQTDAELVVAVYDEQQIQMLASGNKFVSQGETTAEITISGDMPQYFVATAYLLDKESHAPLCAEYTTKLYVKALQDLKNSTVDDYDPDKVLQFDSDDKKTNFAVFNDETVTEDEGGNKNQLTDNKDGTYTIINATSSFTELRVGDTFSYNYEDGTILLVKIADIAVNGTTVTVHEDTNTDLNDYFDYVKIETDGTQGSWNVDNSDLEEGITPTDSEADIENFSAGTSRIGVSAGSEFSTSYNIYKEFNDQVKVTGSFKYSFSFAVDLYITSVYQYCAVKNEYSAGISIDITGKLNMVKIPIGRISVQPIPCINVGFTPFFVVSASGTLEWSGEIKGTTGGAFDSNSGFRNLSSSPSCENTVKLEGKFFVGVEATPYISIISSNLAKASLEFLGGVEITATYPVYDSSKDQVHECKACLKGELKSKLSLEFTVDLIKDMISRKRSFDLGAAKIGDFYYSFDYNEAGWNTCPHICYPVAISVRDKDGNEVEGVSMVTVTDKKNGKTVELRDKESRMDSVSLMDSKSTKVYLPNGSYVVHAVKEELKGKADVSVYNRSTEIIVKFEDVEVPPIINPIDENSVQFGQYPQTKVDDNSELYEQLRQRKNSAENNIITYKGKRYYESGYDFYQFEPILWKKVSGDDAKTILISDKILDNYTYGKIDTMCVSWNNSDLRRWCNNEFLNMAFTKEEQECIPSNTWYACDWNNEDSMVTEDKVSVPSHEMIEKLSQDVQRGVGTEYSGVDNHNYYTSCTGSYFGVWNYPIWVTSSNDFSKSYPANWSRGIRICISLNITLANNVEEQKTTLDETADEVFSFTDGENPSSEDQEKETEFTDGVSTSEVGDVGEEEQDKKSESELPEQNGEIIKETPEEDFDANSEALREEEFDTNNEELPEDVDTDNEVLSEENFNTDNEKITEVSMVPVLSVQDEPTVGSSKMFTDLVPYSSYLFVMVKDENTDKLLDASNLLYISQKTADENGTASFNYILREPFESPISKTFGARLKNIKDVSVTLSKTKYVYNGRAKKPSVTVMDADYLLQNGVDYMVTYLNNIEVGKAAVNIIGKGSYTGKVKASFIIQPAKNVIKASNITKKVSEKAQTIKLKVTIKDKAKLKYSSNNKAVKVDTHGKIVIAKKFIGKAVITVTAAKTARYKKTSRKITVTVRPLGTSFSELANTPKGRVKIAWKRNKFITGYKIQYSTDKKFRKNVKTINISKNNITKAILSKLKKGRTYYVRIATYKKTTERVYSSWSKVKKVEIKK